MLHKFFEPGDWFAPKTYGYGAGAPIAWQGWVLTAAYVLVLTGLALAAALDGGQVMLTVAIALMLFLTAAFVVIARKRTRGGWRWRWGEEE